MGEFLSKHCVRVCQTLEAREKKGDTLQRVLNYHVNVKTKLSDNFVLIITQNIV
jgi:hypothetical protein